MHEINDLSELFDTLKRGTFDDSYPVNGKPYYYVKDETWKEKENEKKKQSNLNAWSKLITNE